MSTLFAAFCVRPEFLHVLSFLPALKDVCCTVASVCKQCRTVGRHAETVRYYLRENAPDEYRILRWTEDKEMFRDWKYLRTVSNILELRKYTLQALQGCRVSAIVQGKGINRFRGSGYTTYADCSPLGIFSTDENSFRLAEWHTVVADKVEVDFVSQTWCCTLTVHVCSLLQNSPCSIRVVLCGGGRDPGAIHSLPVGLAETEDLHQCSLQALYLFQRKLCTEECEMQQSQRTSALRSSSKLKDWLQKAELETVTGINKSPSFLRNVQLTVFRDLVVQSVAEWPLIGGEDRHGRYEEFLNSALSCPTIDYVIQNCCIPPRHSETDVTISRFNLWNRWSLCAAALPCSVLDRFFWAHMYECSGCAPWFAAMLRDRLSQCRDRLFKKGIELPPCLQHRHPHAERLLKDEINDYCVGNHERLLPFSDEDCLSKRFASLEEAGCWEEDAVIGLRVEDLTFIESVDDRSQYATLYWKLGTTYPWYSEFVTAEDFPLPAKHLDYLLSASSCIVLDVSQLCLWQACKDRFSTPALTEENSDAMALKKPTTSLIYPPVTIGKLLQQTIKETNSLFRSLCKPKDDEVFDHQSLPPDDDNTFALRMEFRKVSHEASSASFPPALSNNSEAKPQSSAAGCLGSALSPYVLLCKIQFE